MNAPEKSKERNWHRCLLPWALLLCVLPSGCGSCFRSPAPDSDALPLSPLAAQLTQTPGSPVGGVAQTPFAPHYAQTPVSPFSVPEPSPPEPPVQLTLHTVEDIQPGMTYDEVRELLGRPGMVVAGTDERNSVYRWSYSGMSFMGRFEQGVLVRKNIVSPDEELRDYPDDDTMQLDRALYEQVQAGMTFDEVMALIGMDAQPLTSQEGRVTIFKWTDESGSSFTGRFDNRVLTRKTGLIIASGDDAVENETTDETDVYEPEYFDDVEDDSVPEDSYRPERVVAAQPPSIQRSAPVAPARVRVAGTTRRDRELARDDSPHAGRSYRPAAKLPDYRRRLRRGAYEIRVYNTTDSRARAAIVSSEGGLELNVAPNGRASAFVNQGTYQVYFIYDDDPHTLHQGQSIPVQETLSDFAVYLFGDTYDVNFLER